MARRGGRPTGFDEATALRGAVVAFWERGYAATTLPQLLSAMGVARSTFYASFGSKHRVMLAALDLYRDELLARMQAAADSEPDAARALRAAFDIAACTPRPAHGCLFVNMIMELAPHDAEVGARARAYLQRVERLFAGLLVRGGEPAAGAGPRSSALVALAAGAVTLRKAGESDRKVARLLNLAPLLLGDVGNGTSGRRRA